MVPPGTAGWAGARTLSAVSPVSSSSLVPFCPTCPPFVGSNWPAGAPPLAAGTVVLEPSDVWAPALPSRLAPMAPPVTAVATSAAPATALRIDDFIWLPFSFVLLRPNGSGVEDEDRAARSGHALGSLGIPSDSEAKPQLTRRN